MDNNFIEINIKEQIDHRCLIRISEIQSIYTVQRNENSSETIIKLKDGSMIRCIDDYDNVKRLLSTATVQNQIGYDTAVVNIFKINELYADDADSLNEVLNNDLFCTLNIHYYMYDNVKIVGYCL